MVLTTIVVTASDPTDPTIAVERLYKLAQRSGMAQLDFDPDEYDFHCDICDTHVLKNTKHCQRCNRCTYEFDHHCVWLSNDIGLHNYAEFFRMLVAVLCTILSQIAFSIYTLVFAYRIDSDDDAEIGFMTRSSMIALTWVNLVVCLILLLLDTYLVTYHTYLICNNLTTYKHIRKQ